MRIRPAAIADIAAMHRIRLRVLENRLSDPFRVTEESYLPYILASSAWVAEIDRGIAGFAAVDIPARQVWALFVDPEAEATGLGRALHDRMLAWAIERGIERLSLATSRGTRAALFYERAGWTETGVDDSGELCFEKTLTPKSRNQTR